MIFKQTSIQWSHSYMARMETVVFFSFQMLLLFVWVGRLFKCSRHVIKERERAGQKRERRFSIEKMMKNRMQCVFNKHEFPLNGTGRSWEEINVYLSLTDERDSIYTWQAFNENLPSNCKNQKRFRALRCWIHRISVTWKHTGNFMHTHTAQERERWHPSFNFKRLIELRRIQSKRLSILLPHFS